VKIFTLKKELKRTEPVFNIQYKVSLEGKMFSRANLHFIFPAVVRNRLTSMKAWWFLYPRKR